MKSLQLSIDHPALTGAKACMDTCLKAMVEKAISTGSNEGTATLKISMQIIEVLNEKTKEWEKQPIIKFKVGWAVPIKQSAEGKLPAENMLVRNPEGEWCMIQNQVSMDELMDDDGDDENDEDTSEQ